MHSSRFEPVGFGVGSLLNDRYELVRKIGAGGMSVVYEAMDRALNNDRIAVKIFSPSLVSDSQMVERFHNEVLIMRKLSHPNIVRTFEFAQMGRGGFLMTMEYVNGVNLEQLLNGSALRERPSFGETVRILLEVCRAMSYAHKLGVIHRDLKPANILLSEQGEVKIADFGLARARAFTDKALTQVGECVGTPYYMAPEQIQEQEIDARADIYSIGIIGFELVTGAPPFQDSSWFELASKIIKEPMPEFPKRLRPPAWYRQFVLKASAKSPKDRFQSIEEVIVELEKHVSSESTFALDVPATNPKTRAAAILSQRTGKRKSFGFPGINLMPLVFLLSVGCLVMLILSVLTDRAGSSISEGVNRGMSVLDKVSETAKDLRTVVNEVVKHQDVIRQTMQAAREGEAVIIQRKADEAKAAAATPPKQDADTKTVPDATAKEKRESKPAEPSPAPAAETKPAQ